MFDVFSITYNKIMIVHYSARHLPRLFLLLVCVIQLLFYVIDYHKYDHTVEYQFTLIILMEYRGLLAEAMGQECTCTSSVISYTYAKTTSG